MDYYPAKAVRIRVYNGPFAGAPVIQMDGCTLKGADAVRWLRETGQAIIEAADKIQADLDEEANGD